MEMPFDILNQRLGKIRDNGDIDFDNTATAMDIDQELQDKFVFFPFEELEAVEIENDREVLHAGSGPEHCSATSASNPTWLYNHAMNALALWWRLKRDQEREEAKQATLAKLARRPQPGVYQAFAHLNYFTVIVPDDRRVLVSMTNGGLRDASQEWDAYENGPWALQRIDLTDGTVQ